MYSPSQVISIDLKETKNQFSINKTAVTAIISTEWSDYIQLISIHFLFYNLWCSKFREPAEIPGSYGEYIL